MSDEVVTVQRFAGVGVLTLNRPDALNALDREMMRRLTQAAHDMAQDDDVRCVVLTGAGGNFCAGGDLRAIKKAADDLADRQAPPGEDSTKKRSEWVRRSAEASRLLHEMPKPTLAMIHGACAGAGLSLAAACDMRFAGESARFRSAFTAMGLPGDYGGSWLWTRILGPSRARQLYFFDKRRGAHEALEFGLVDEVYPDELLDETVMEKARYLASLPGAGLAYAKANLNSALEEDFAASLDRESEAMILARNVLVEERQRKSAGTKHD